MGKQSCYLCLIHNSLKLQESWLNPPVFHGFPANVETRLHWTKICGLNEDVDNVTNLKICSKHFTAGDYVNINDHKFGGRRRLKSSAVPIAYNVASNEATANEQDMELELPVTPTLHEQDIKLEFPVTPTLHEQDIKLEFPVTPILHEQDIKLERPVTPLCIKRGKFVKTPRYIGDIASLHVATPRRTQAVLKMVKDKFKKHESTIKVLKQKNRRLLKKISTLEQLVTCLKRKNLISAEAEESLLVQNFNV
ncbi:uncharacterized protein [Tenebrio molitor]|jgi:hypothetical protein|uniref:uncharacterized protein isoform X2 n=1 Tax=Tenebrio molitor TaxID=7067 RepID=UPI0036246D57